MPMFRRALFATLVVLIALAFVPSQLAAEERKAPTGIRVSASVLDLFSAVWSELTAWFAGAVAQPPIAAAPLTGIWANSAGCVDPNGRPTPCPATTSQQGGCDVDGLCAE